MFLLTSSAIQSLIEASSASLEHGWEVGWSLASYSDGPQPLANARQSQVFMFGLSLHCSLNSCEPGQIHDGMKSSIFYRKNGKKNVCKL